MQPTPNKGTYTRYIPHYDYAGMYQNITFRLADSLPKYVAEELVELAEFNRNAELRAKIENILNNGHGACWLRDPKIAQMVVDTLQFFDAERYQLIAWVIMPNHVHVLIRLFEGFPMHKILDSWKTWTARHANQIVGRKGRFWDRGFFDRYIRDDTHYWNVIQYIHDNPVKAGLVDRASEWEFSSIMRFPQE